jgi:transcriptional regulator with PAS, ATPase and Fis domain
MPEKDYGVLATGSRAMREALSLCDRVADTEISILIVGESGVGKELIARALHANNAQRKDARFVAINCAAIPATLLESELFGYKAGAFTGAQRDKKGLIEEAEGGTLFFDEIAELDTSVQVKLLRVLQEREYMPVGGTKPKQCNVRIVAATNRDIDREIKDGKFRDDLFYRLCQIRVVIPPLRDRTEDIPELVKQFVAEAVGDREIKIEGSLMKRMVEYSWPGNVRELQNLIRVACALTEGNEITIRSIPDTAPFAQYQWGGRGLAARREGWPHDMSITTEEEIAHTTIDDQNAYDLGKSWRDYEILIIAKSFEHNNFHASRTAAELGIATATLYKRIKEWNLKDRSNPLYQDPFTYEPGIKLDEYVPRIFKAALDAAEGRAMQAIANLKVSQGYFYKIMKRFSAR